MVLFTVTLQKRDIIQPVEYVINDYLNKYISALKNKFGVFDFFFIYKNTKVFFDLFLRQYPLEYEPFWAFFNQSFLILYAVAYDDPICVYRDSQRLYPVNSTLVPTYFIPFNWRGSGLVYTNNTQSPTLFPDNNRYFVFSNVHDILSFIIERGEIVPYENPEYVNIYGDLANVPIKIQGSSALITVNSQFPSYDKRYRAFNILLIYTDNPIVDMTIGQQADVLNFTQINNENIDVPDKQSLLSYFVPLHTNYDPLNTINVNFQFSGGFIYKCLVSKTPILGNSVLYNPYVGDDTESYLGDLIPKDQFITGSYFDGTSLVPDSAQCCFHQFKTFLNSLTTDYYCKLPPPGVANSQRFYQCFGKFNLYNGGGWNSDIQGVETYYNMNYSDLGEREYVSFPTAAPLVFMSATWGLTYAPHAINLYGKISEFPAYFTNYTVFDKFISTTQLKSTQSSSDFDWLVLSNTSDTLNFPSVVANYSQYFALRYDTSFSNRYIISSNDAFTHGVRSDIINLNHYVNMKFPTRLVLNFREQINIHDSNDQRLNFSLAGISQQMLTTLSSVSAVIFFENILDNADSVVNIITGSVLSNVVYFQNKNQASLEPLLFFNGIRSSTSWRRCDYLSSTANYFLNIKIDENTNPDFKVYVTVSLLFA